MKIYKYQLEIAPVQKLLLPIGYQVLSLQMQGNTPVVWILIYDGSAPTEHTIECYPTGGTMHNPARHIGTVQDGGYVWHFFDTTSQ